MVHRPLPRLLVATLVVAVPVLACDDPPEDPATETDDDSTDEDDGADDEDTTGEDGGTESTGDDEPACLDRPEVAEVPNASDPLMQTWGAACDTDEDCRDLLGDPDAVCDAMAVVYELPGRYCTKPCELPDTSTRVVKDAPDCDPEGGVACVGQRPVYQRCAKICTDDDQCERAGYECRQMPSISQSGDPEFCLMPDCCLERCE